MAYFCKSCFPENTPNLQQPSTTRFTSDMATESAVQRGERAWYSSNSENAMKIDETVVQSFRHCGIPTQEGHQTGTADTKQSTCYCTLPSHINERLTGLRLKFYLGRRDNRRNAECISRRIVEKIIATNGLIKREELDLDCASSTVSTTLGITSSSCLPHLHP
jgi:hypothetical protein